MLYLPSRTSILQGCTRTSSLNPFLRRMPDLDTETTETTTPTGTALTAREKRDLQRAQLRPLANLRPELYDEDDYSPDELESMMAMYNGTMASIEEGEIVKSRVLDIRDNL